MKRTLFLLILISAFCYKASAQAEAHGPNDPNFSAKCPTGQYLMFTITSKEDPYTVTVNGIRKDEDNSKKLEIPATVHYRNVDFTVTKINQSAFKEHEILASVIIPKTVSVIGPEAFYGCKALKTLKIGGEIMHCGENAFAETAITAPIYTGNTLVYCPANQKEYKINNGTTTILEYAFSNCNDMSEITIPSSVSTIYTSSFAHCDNLSSITIEQGNKFYNSKYNCNAIIREADNTLIFGCKNSSIPDGVKTIGRTAFLNSQITSIEIPNSVTNIEDSAFFGCQLEKITIPQSVKIIGKNAFTRCKKLAVVNFDAIDCQISDKDFPVFEGCLNFTSVNFGENVKVVPAYGFKDCTELRYATLSNSVKEIGDEAFSGCSMLSYMEIPNNIEIAYGSSFIGTGITEPLFNEHLFIYLPKGYNAKYSIPNGITTIASRAFFENETLTSLTIANSVTTISDNAFEQANGLKSITIPNSVTKIGKSAFRFCSKLTSITLPNSITTIEEETFSGCAHIKSITIPNSVTTIKKEFVYWCDTLESVTLPNSVVDIDANAFYGCETIKHIYVPKGSKEKFKKLIATDLHKLIVEK